MTESELYHTLALMQVEGVGDVIAKNSSNIAETLQKFSLQKIPTSKIDGIGSVVIKIYKDKSVFAKAEAELHLLHKKIFPLLIFKKTTIPKD